MGAWSSYHSVKKCLERYSESHSSSPTGLEWIETLHEENVD